MEMTSQQIWTELKSEPHNCQQLLTSGTVISLLFRERITSKANSSLYPTLNLKYCSINSKVRGIRIQNKGICGSRITQNGAVVRVSFRFMKDCFSSSPQWNALFRNALKSGSAIH
ncbi:hypothetical protein PoB_000361800 [Plakobranchus ocellatus]|uniref:Uncharacterized protein n=1 Tax=Plakobranchus ocellatus TaxID=259542 RepID=A0AAV3Y445_9GAST|nr:hypothetical protein PoB_000361800 [Plakobranchus ocellatus]